MQPLFIFGGVTFPDGRPPRWCSSRCVDSALHRQDVDHPAVGGLLVRVDRSGVGSLAQRVRLDQNIGGQTKTSRQAANHAH